MRTTTRVFAAVVLVTTFLLPQKPALACTCARGPAREAMQYTDAAFIGSIVRRAPFPGGHQFFDLVYTFRVTESFKRDLGSEVHVASSESSGACGLYAFEGEQAFFLEEYKPGRYAASSCSSVEPDVLRRAARPLPAPDGWGPPAFILGGAFGDVRTISLDAAGRTLGYGRGEGWINKLIACPGKRRLVELITRDNQGISIGIRELPSLGFEEIALPPGIDSPDSLSLVCLDEEAHDVLLFWSDVKSGGSIWKRQGDAWQRTWVGKNVGAGNFVGPTAYLTTVERSPRLITLDVRTGSRRTIARVPPQSRSWIRSPDGRRFAGLSATWPRSHPPRLVVVDLAAEPPAVASKRTYLVCWSCATIHWLDNDRLAFLPAGYGRLRIFDPSLRLIEKWKEPGGLLQPIISGHRVYGTLPTPPRLASVRLADGKGQQVIGGELEEGVSTLLILPTDREASGRNQGEDGIQGTTAKRGSWILGLLLIGMLAGVWLLGRRRGRKQES